MTLRIESSDIVRLIHSHLTECGLHESCRMLRSESGVGAGGYTSSARPNWKLWCHNGEWGKILEALSTLDRKRCRISDTLIADIHEMTILELAEGGELSLAYATLRLVEKELDEAAATSATVQVQAQGQEQQEQKQDDSNDPHKERSERASSSMASIPRSRELEQRLAALASLRSTQRKNQSGQSGSTDPAAAAAAASNQKKNMLPQNFYGPLPKEKRREQIGKRLAQSIPEIPSSRLITLIQQAVKWQSHTGQIPRIRELWEHNDEDNDEQERDKNNDDNENDDTRKRKQPPEKESKKQKRNKKPKKVFDLLLGEVDVDPILVGQHIGWNANAAAEYYNNDLSSIDPVPTKPYSTIPFGKKATVEAAAFLPDGSGLITGSSDGLAEIWDPKQKYAKLRVEDLEYQRKDELLGHSNTTILALTVSNDNTMLATASGDGILKVWNIATGSCLRSITVHADGSPVSCLAFSPDHSHILTGGSNNGICREFGLRTSRMLKQFHGHASTVTTCFYKILGSHANNGREENNNEAAEPGQKATNEGSNKTQPSSSSSPKLTSDKQICVVVTASADGTVRIWSAKTSEIIHVLRPVSMGQNALSMSSEGTSIVQSASSSASGGGGDSGAIITTSPSIPVVLNLHTPVDTMIIVPRGIRIFLVNYNGMVLRTFQDDTSKSNAVYVAATVSPSNIWLYAVKEDGLCCIFNISTGKLEKTISDFGTQTTTSSNKKKPKKDANASEISSIIHHPHKGIVAAFSNDKGQKRGQLVLWK